MTNKIGRNDPCPCGSGKKLKKCHGSIQKRPPPPPITVVPARYPKPITHHFVGNEEGWSARPGLLAARIQVIPAESLDAGLVDLWRGWGQRMKELGLTDSHMASLSADARHKLRGVRYHLDNYRRREDELLQKFKLKHHAPAGATMVEDDASLIFEMEAFLFQAKSSLDMLMRLLRGLGFASIGHSFGDKGDDVLKALDNLPRSCEEQKAAMKRLVTEAQAAWMRDMIATRDNVAHNGELHDLVCFQEEPYIGDPTVLIRYPTMPSGERVRLYLERIETNLREFVRAFCQMAFQAAAMNRSGTTEG